MNQLSPLELEIYYIVKGFAQGYFSQNIRTNRFITRSLKEKLGHPGIKKGFIAASSGFKELFENEWLYDMRFGTEQTMRMI